MGIYDLKLKEVLFDPQIIDINFLDDGDISIEIFDEELGRKIEKIIDHNGKDRFKSVYSSINTWIEPYEVVVRDDNGYRHGLIDKNEKVLLPCKYDVAWNGILHSQRRMIFKENGKQGVVDYVRTGELRRFAPCSALSAEPCSAQLVDKPRRACLLRFNRQAFCLRAKYCFAQKD